LQPESNKRERDPSSGSGRRRLLETNAAALSRFSWNQFERPSSLHFTPPPLLLLQRHRGWRLLQFKEFPSTSAGIFKNKRDN
jgi:hypothetical protein